MYQQLVQLLLVLYRAHCVQLQHFFCECSCSGAMIFAAPAAFLPCLAAVSAGFGHPAGSGMHDLLENGG